MAKIIKNKIKFLTAFSKGPSSYIRLSIGTKNAAVFPDPGKLDFKIFNVICLDMTLNAKLAVERKKISCTYLPVILPEQNLCYHLITNQISGL